MSTALVWLRNDLRLEDNPALFGAVRGAESVAPVFIWSPGEGGIWSPGPASRAWLARSLVSLGDDIAARGGRLAVVAGQTGLTLRALADEIKATTVHWNRRFEPSVAALDDRVREFLEDAGLRVEVHDGPVLREPDTLLSVSGTPYQVFTPFAAALEKGPPPALPLPAPERITSPENLRVGIDPASIAARLTGAPDIAGYWTPGEAGATANIDLFLSELVDDYVTDRERPDRHGTSRLSPHLAFGEISPRTLWHRAHELADRNRSPQRTEAVAAFSRQILWREFAYYLLHHFPTTPEHPLRQRFEVFPWSREPAELEAWQLGQTGIPIVDAGMRELRATGWMHNRVRMVAASVLTKDLLLPWIEGARCFWDLLADADLANNTLGWQWVAGCGADAAPYFRIFNPVTQGRRFDPDGAYVRQWVPELAGLTPEWIHRPWAAPGDVLSSAGVVLGKQYPAPIVDHAAARLRALAIYESIRDVAR